MKDGVIANFEVTEAMLRHFISKVHNGRVRAQPHVVIAVPSGITEVEKRAVQESAMQAGAREVYLIEEPMAAAIGVGLPVQDPAGNMIIDIGGGTTEVAIISLSGIVFSSSLRVAGDELDKTIVRYMKRSYNLMSSTESVIFLVMQHSNCVISIWALYLAGAAPSGSINFHGQRVGP